MGDRSGGKPDSGPWLRRVALRRSKHQEKEEREVIPISDDGF